MKKISRTSALTVRDDKGTVEFSMTYVDGKSESFEIRQAELVNFSISIHTSLQMPAPGVAGRALDHAIGTDKDGNVFLQLLYPDNVKVGLLMNRSLATKLSINLQACIDSLGP